MFEDLKVLIIEDQEIIAENLSRILTGINIGEIQIATNAPAAERLLKTTQFHLLLVDINLGKKSITGTQLMKKMATEEPIPHIYITANTDDKNIKEAVDTSPEGFIEKPFSRSAIHANLKIALNKLKEEKLVTLMTNNKKKLVSVRDIYYIKANHNYISIYLEGGKKFIERSSLKKFQKKLTKDFIQVHKSYVINLKKISSYTASEIMVLNNKVPVGRSFKEQTKSKLE